MADSRSLVAVARVVAALGAAVDVVADGFLEIDVEANRYRGEIDENIREVPRLLLDVRPGE